MSAVEVETAPPEVIRDEGDHDLFTHIVSPASAYWEAVVNGTPCRALCGKLWVPSKNPSDYEKCPTCVEVLDAAVAKRWGV